MFQYASLKGIASNRGYEYCIPPKESFGANDLNVRNSDCDIYNVFDIESKNKVRFSSNQCVMERMHEFDKDLFDNCPDRVDLLGYFQTEKYFKHIEDEIRADFTFNSELVENCKEFVKDSANGGKVISLHVRRGDYISNPNHPVQTIDYYKQALENLPEDCLVLVFSDDSEWCSNQEFFSGDRFLISQNSSTDADLCMMTFCDYHIIANSSFSWWGAWLAKSNKVIAPKNWFGAECANKNIKDMAFGDWSWL